MTISYPSGHFMKRTQSDPAALNRLAPTGNDNNLYAFSPTLSTRQNAVPSCCLAYGPAHLARPLRAGVVATTGWNVLGMLPTVQTNRADASPVCLKRSHLMTSSSLPTFTNAAMALSRCSRSCPADSCTRMRACPLGTTG